MLAVYQPPFGPVQHKSATGVAGGHWNPVRGPCLRSIGLDPAGCETSFHFAKSAFSQFPLVFVPNLSVHTGSVVDSLLRALTLLSIQLETSPRDGVSMDDLTLFLTSKNVNPDVLPRPTHPTPVHQFPFLPPPVVPARSLPPSPPTHIHTISFLQGNVISRKMLQQPMAYNGGLKQDGQATKLETGAGNNGSEAVGTVSGLIG